MHTEIVTAEADTTERVHIEYVRRFRIFWNSGIRVHWVVL